MRSMRGAHTLKFPGTGGEHRGCGFLSGGAGRRDCVFPTADGSQFYDLMFRRAQPYFYVFDVLWMDGDARRGLARAERILRRDRAGV